MVAGLVLVAQAESVPRVSSRATGAVLALIFHVAAIARRALPASAIPHTGPRRNFIHGHGSQPQFGPVRAAEWRLPSGPGAQHALLLVT